MISGGGVLRSPDLRLYLKNSIRPMCSRFPLSENYGILIKSAKEDLQQQIIILNLL